MAEAVRAVVEIKFGAGGLFRGAGHGSAWPKHAEVTGQIPAISEAAVVAASAYGEYVWHRYGRFPACVPPYRTVMSFQACHLDAEFYDKFYKPEALTERQRNDFKKRTT
jgi:hypothetical protein